MQRIIDRIHAVLRPEAEVLMVVPPFAAETRPQLGVHLMQGVARAQGLETQVLYANLMFAALIGEANYRELREMDHRHSLLGERVFANAAHGMPPLGHDRGASLAARDFGEEEIARLAVVANLATDWVGRVADLIGDNNYRVVGLTSSFEQINASTALAKAVKARSPGTRVVVGGANCQGSMAEGTAAHCDAFDAIFQGEAERTFAAYLATLSDGGRHAEPSRRVRRGAPTVDLDALPPVDYADYYDQVDRCLPLSLMRLRGAMSMAFETSRGCWWGQKHHCTFCGLEKRSMGYREKSADRAVADLVPLVEEHERRTGSRRIFMVDNIMPYSFFSTLVPRLAGADLGLDIFYEQKANLSLDHLGMLAAAGVCRIQPGIEALSDTLLKAMDKGTSAHQNVNLLRYALAHGVGLGWNLLCDLPGDVDDAYRETLDLLPSLLHLPPPMRLGRLRIDRFSPYFERPEAFGITDLRPLSAYFDVLPKGFDVASVAYHFQGRYDGVRSRNPRLLKALSDAVDAWIARWRSDDRPQLRVRRDSTGRLWLLDTRRDAAARERQILEGQARAALSRRPTQHCDPEDIAWALEAGVAASTGRTITALAVADAELMEELDGRAPSQRTAGTRATA